MPKVAALSGVATAVASSQIASSASSRKANPASALATKPIALEDLIGEAATLLGTDASASGNGWKFALSTKGGRQQTVHVLRAGADQESELVSFLSLCGEASPANAMALLEWNGRLTGCAFAVRTLGGKPMFVLTANWPAQLLDVSLIVETLQSIARRADQVEMKLSTGKDKF